LFSSPYFTELRGEFQWFIKFEMCII
jgi:hypothetical protein